MTPPFNCHNHLKTIGWKPFFEQQLTDSEFEQNRIARVSAHHGGLVILLTGGGENAIPVQTTSNCGDLAVGDWLLLDAEMQRAIRRLERDTVLERKAAGETVKPQLIAANIDTLFIVSSCNLDFNPSRLERYLALALESGATPVVVLTKKDLCEDPAAFRQQAERLHSGLIAETIDARREEDASILSDWCKVGQTVALLGSSGVGKSTLAIALGSGPILTAGIREDDAKGRHTTTARSMHRLNAGGLLIDNPGIRELQLPSCEQGVEDLFEDVVSLFQQCKYRNCSHQGDAGCAVIAAIESGDLERRRFRSYMKLNAEQARNSQSLAERRMNDRKLGKFYKSVQASNKKRQHE